MDFNNYPNIALLDKALGGSKQTAMNKKRYASAEERWNRLGVDELGVINAEAASAVRILDCYVTPNYILYMNLRVLYVIPVRDVVWMYTSVVTDRMNFIPYNKTHNLFLLDRTGETFSLGMKNTGGFSKKTPCNDAMQQIVQIIGPQRRGMLVGWTQQIADAVKTNFYGVVQSVDANSVQ